MSKSLIFVIMWYVDMCTTNQLTILTFRLPEQCSGIYIGNAQMPPFLIYSYKLTANEGINFFSYVEFPRFTTS